MDRIHFDVSDNFVEFGVIADPMVEGFVLPEGLSSCAENLICEARARALDRPRNFPEGFAGKDQDVDVVRHDDPGEEVAKLPSFGSDEKSFGYPVGDSWIS